MNALLKSKEYAKGTGLMYSQDVIIKDFAVISGILIGWTLSSSSCRLG
jgi:hypothetical protein